MQMSSSAVYGGWHFCSLYRAVGSGVSRGLRKPPVKFEFATGTQVTTGKVPDK